MKRVVIESPYSSGTPTAISAVVARNVHYLRACVRDSLLRGEAPYASHGLYTQEGVLDDTVPEERRLGMEAGWSFLWVASLSAAYLDLGWSSGMRAGVDMARSLGIVVEERRLGGAWGECSCAMEPVKSWDGNGDRSESSTHSCNCPLWRAPP